MAAKAHNPEAAWPVAARAVARWLEHGERLDGLLESGLQELTGAERGRAQQLVLGAVRHWGRVEASLRRLWSRSPRPLARAVLVMLGAELAAAEKGEGSMAKIVHHAVEQAKSMTSPPEAGMINAVARKLAVALAGQTEPPAGAGAAEWAEFYSHPEWLVERWRERFGDDKARALLVWNQTPGALHARWRAAEAPPAWMTATAWPNFFSVPAGHWAELELLLASGKIYLQDPSTRLAAGLLAPQPGETILDLCAAPGGKSLLMADAMLRGQLTAVDLPGARLARLRENLARAPAGVTTALVESDARRLDADGLRARGLPASFSAILLDVPCSNSGVIRHRADVKWRLQPGDFARQARQQQELLAAAARWVAPGGRLVYSTCSLDGEENERVVAAFLPGAGGEFALEARMFSWPPDSGCDGAAAFLLRKKGMSPQIANARKIEN
jgi:16S rRNA (cytosine967-C5)-methyltransferase